VSDTAKCILYGFHAITAFRAEGPQAALVLFLLVPSSGVPVSLAAGHVFDPAAARGLTSTPTGG